jgi:hypothetical protein
MLSAKGMCAPFGTGLETLLMKSPFQCWCCSPDICAPSQVFWSRHAEFDGSKRTISSSSAETPSSLATAFSYQPTTLTTASIGSPAVVPAPVVPYRGDVYSVIANGTYILNQSTDVFAGYAFSKADYGQNNSAGGVPVGIQYQMHGVQAGIERRWGKNISTKLQYSFSYYGEPSSGRAAPRLLFGK